MATSPEGPRTVFVNGDFVPASEATVSIMDRGLLFADAVYEGIGVLDGKLVNFDFHMDRLADSLRAIGVPAPLTRGEWRRVLEELVRRAGAEEAACYLQVTRGTAVRGYLPPEEIIPNVFAFVLDRHAPGADDPVVAMTLTSVVDTRWARRDIKSTNLLGQVRAKQVQISSRVIT